MSHPTNKHHREVIGAAKRVRRLTPFTPEERIRFRGLHGRDDTTRACSCFWCKNPRYKRSSEARS